MLSIPMLKHNFKACLVPFIIIFAFLVMYTTVIIYMYNPELAEMLQGYQKALPEMMAAVGMTGVAASLIEWIQIYLYGFIMLLFPLIFIIIAVNKLVMGFIDNGSMAGILATPNSRGKIIITQLLSLYIWLSAFGSGRCIFYKERFDIVRGANQSVTLLFRHIKIVNLHKIK